MPICAPRIFCSSSPSSLSRSRPSNTARPLTFAPRVSPMIVWVDTLLPEPDSPTMPSVCPASTWNEIPRTACTTPSGVGNDTCRSSTSSSATPTHPSRGSVLSYPGGRRVFLQPRTHLDCNPTPGAPVGTAAPGGITYLSAGRQPGGLSQILVGSNCWIAGTYTALCT